MHLRRLPSVFLRRLPAFLADWRGMLLMQALIVFLLMSPELIAGRVFVDNDTTALNYPFQFFLFSLKGWQSGSFLWNPLNFHGFPSFLGETSSFDPIAQLLSLILPPFAAYHWTLCIDMSLGGFFFSLLLRRFHLSPLAAWVGGFAYTTMMWWNMRWISSTIFPSTAPLLLWIIWDSKTKPWRALLLGSMLEIYIWSSMHWIHLPLVWTLGLIFCIGIVIMTLREKKRIDVRPLIVFCASVAIGAVVWLPKILPALMYADVSLRSNGVDWSIASTGGFTFYTLLRFFFPYLSFPLISDSGRAFVFIGTFAILFVCAAVMLRRTKALWYLLAGYFFFFLLGLDHSPLLHLLLKVPPFSYVRSEGPWITVANIALVAIAAVGFDALMSDSASHLRRRLAQIVMWCTAAFFACGVITIFALHIFRTQILSWMYHEFDTRFLAHTSGLPLAHYHATLAGYITEISTNLNPLYPQTGFALLALAVFAVLLSERVWREMGDLRASIIALASIITAFPLVFMQMTPLTVSRTDFPFATQTAAYVKQHAGMTFSVFPNFAKFLTLDQMQPTLAEGVRFQAEMMVPNRNLWYGVSSIDYFDNFMSRRMGTLLGWVGSEQIQGNGWLATEPLTPEKKVALMLSRKDILDMLNAKTFLSIWPLQDPSLTLAATLSLPRNIPLYVYDNKTARPFAYFANSVVTIKPDETAALHTLTQNRWPDTRSLIECDVECSPQQPGGSGSVTVIEKQPTRLTMQTTAQSPQWLIVSVNNLPGWRVTVDGKSILPSMANGTFFGIPVPAGTHTVHMAFTYASLLQDSVSWLRGKVAAKLHHT